MTEYYVIGCIEIGGTVGHETDEEAEFFTLYEKDAAGLSKCIADFTDRLSAEAAMQVYQERDDLQQQLEALAAEAANMRNAIDQTIGWQESVDPENEESVRMLIDLKTPATDAIKRQWKADGAMKVADSLLRMVSVAAKRDKETILSLSRKAEDIAAQLRQPEEKSQ